MVTVVDHRCTFRVGQVQLIAAVARGGGLGSDAVCMIDTNYAVQLT